MNILNLISTRVLLLLLAGNRYLQLNRSYISLGVLYEELREI